MKESNYGGIDNETDHDPTIASLTSKIQRVRDLIVAALAKSHASKPMKKTFLKLKPIYA